MFSLVFFVLLDRVVLIVSGMLPPASSHTRGFVFAIVSAVVSQRVATKPRETGDKILRENCVLSFAPICVALNCSAVWLCARSPRSYLAIRVPKPSLWYSTMTTVLHAPRLLVSLEAQLCLTHQPEPQFPFQTKNNKNKKGEGFISPSLQHPAEPQQTPLW